MTMFCLQEIVIPAKSPKGARAGIQVKMFKTWIPAFAGMTTLVFILCLPAFAANKNVGTSGAQFLKIGPGARPAGMGEAFTGVADDIHAVYYNPAGLGFQDQTQVTAMHTQWFQDTNYEFGAFVHPTQSGTFGISATTLKVEGFNRRNADESASGFFDTVDASYALSYGKKWNDHLSLGVTGRYISQEIDATSAGSWGFDFGVLNRFNRLPISVGLAIRNLGQEIEFVDESDPQPLSIDLGLGYRLLKDRLLLATVVKSPRDNDTQLGVGGEYTQPIGSEMRFALRTGYNTSGTDADGTTGLSLGGGFGFRLFDLDFAWVPFGDLGNTLRYSLSLRF